MACVAKRIPGGTGCLSVTAGSLLESSAKAWRALAALTLVYFVATGWNLQSQFIVSPDEPRYAVAARAMMQGGDPVIPFFNGQPRLEKPVLFHWLLVISGTIAQSMGISLDTAGFRLAPLFMGWLTVLGTYLLGRRVLNHRGAIIAAMILMTSFQFHNVARELVIDMTLSAFLLWSLIFFHVAVERLERRTSAFWPLSGFYLCLGLACMSKGPFLVGIFSTIPLLGYLFWTRRLPLLKSAGLCWGVPLSLLIGLSWFIAVCFKGYDPTPFFSVQNLDRFLGRLDHIHVLPFFFYVISLPEIFAPWAILLPFVAWWSFKLMRQDRTPLTDGAKLVTCALAVSFTIIGLSLSKRHLYLMPLFPFLSLWVACAGEHAFLHHEGLPASRYIAFILRAAGLLFFVGCASAALWSRGLGWQTMEKIGCIIVGALTLVLCFAIAASLLRGERIRAAFGVLAIAALLALGREAVVRPLHERVLNLQSFYSEVGNRLAGRSLVIAGTNSNEASWYLGNSNGPIDEVFERDLKRRFFDDPRVVLLATVPLLARTPSLKDSVIRLSPVAFRNGVPFVLIEPDPVHPPDLSLFKVTERREPGGFFKNL